MTSGGYGSDLATTFPKAVRTRRRAGYRGSLSELVHILQGLGGLYRPVTRREKSPSRLSSGGGDDVKQDEHTIEAGPGGGLRRRSRGGAGAGDRLRLDIRWQYFTGHIVQFYRRHQQPRYFGHRPVRGDPAGAWRWPAQQRSSQRGQLQRNRGLLHDRRLGRIRHRQRPGRRGMLRHLRQSDERAGLCAVLSGANHQADERPARFLVGRSADCRVVHCEQKL